MLVTNSNDNAMKEGNFQTIRKNCLVSNIRYTKRNAYDMIDAIITPCNPKY